MGPDDVEEVREDDKALSELNGHCSGEPEVAPTRANIRR